MDNTNVENFNTYTLISAKPIPRSALHKALNQHAHPWEVLTTETVTLKPLNVNLVTEQHSHRVHGPAKITAEGRTVWSRHGMKHRTGGPAVVTENGTEQWWQYGKKHNPDIDKPAEIHNDGTRKWFNNGHLSRLHGPAVHCENGEEEWWFNFLLHNFNGPAAAGTATKKVRTPAGTTVTFHPRWSVYGIPTRFPEMCEKIIHGDLPLTQLVELFTHEDYVVSSLAKHHATEPVNTGVPYDSENFFKLFATEQDIKDIIMDLLPERLDFVIRTRTLFEEDQPVTRGMVLGEERRKTPENIQTLHITFLNGAPHSVNDEPSTFVTKKNTTTNEQEVGNKFWHNNGELHRLNGPAVEKSQGDAEWWHHGMLHNMNGAAIQRGNGTQEWWVCGELHRTDGPAVMTSKGAKGNEWWVRDVTTTLKSTCENITSGQLDVEQVEELTHHPDYVVREIAKAHLATPVNRNGSGGRRAGTAPVEPWEEKVTTLHVKEPQREKDNWTYIGKVGKKLHNVNGPAVEHANGDKEWWVEGELKRDNGEPTIERADGSKEWWVGKYINSDGFSAPNISEPYLHRVNGPAITFPEGSHANTLNLWWYKGRTTHLNDLCEQATSLVTSSETLYELSIHYDYVVRKLALANPNCPEEGKFFEALKNF